MPNSGKDDDDDDDDAMKTYGGVDVQIHIFLTSTLV
jgi:hypothetical protein